MRNEWLEVFELWVCKNSAEIFPFKVIQAPDGTQVPLSLGSVMKSMHLSIPLTTFCPTSSIYFLLISVYYRTFWQAAGVGGTVSRQEEGHKPFSCAGKNHATNMAATLKNVKGFATGRQAIV
jgi:hypothetical protein